MTTKPARPFRREYKDENGTVVDVAEGQVIATLKPGNFRCTLVVASVQDFAGKEHVAAFRAVVSNVAKAHKVRPSGDGLTYFPAAVARALKTALETEGFAVCASQVA